MMMPGKAAGHGFQTYLKLGTLQWYESRIHLADCAFSLKLGRLILVDTGYALKSPHGR
jgi:hypothetical protein